LEALKTMPTIWQQCYDHEWCVNIPFDGRRCFGIHACVRIIEEPPAFFLELELNGQRQRINLANACVNIPVSIFNLKVCIVNLNISAHSVSFDISVDGCINVSVGPVGINECVPLARQHVVIGKLAAREAEAFLAPQPLETAEPFYVFHNRKAAAREEDALEKAAQTAKWQRL
jgi:hypothetical protein